MEEVIQDTHDSTPLEILYQDEEIVAINKPNGLLVHRSPIATNTNVFAVQELRNQIGQKVSPVHRLDRKTSGILLFALNPESLTHLQSQFENRTVHKVYHAIVRGYTEDEGIIDYPLTNDKGKTQEAITRYKTLERTEVPVAFGKHTTSRYSLVEVYPETGRMHQIRKHFAHILHPIIGDRPHGCNKQNKLFLEKWNLTEMLLHAIEIEFEHPVSGEKIRLKADYQSEFKRMLESLVFNV
ncbi:pseudouridine synthase [Roseivirga sp.]|uniref:pseudouridine synthase n=1 Tax=Roseivirga sp. TaxID=1964215 RepID=UPI002B26795C|nr:pseudouridine synthase [Roseivirga sp.]